VEKDVVRIDRSADYPWIFAKVPRGTEARRVSRGRFTVNTESSVSPR
jgi:hypothetical protein